MDSNEQHRTGGVLEDFPGGAAQGVPSATCASRAMRAHDNEVDLRSAGKLCDAFSGHRICCTNGREKEVIS
jgi:hypothetical protein